MRIRQIRQLLWPTLRAIPWRPLMVAGSLALGYIALAAPGSTIDQKMQALRLAALLVCLAAAFILDDPAEKTIEHLPTSLALRRILRVALLLPSIAVWWWLALSLAGPVPEELGGPLPRASLTWEAVALLAVALAISSLVTRLAWDRLGAVAGPPMLLVAVAALLATPPGRRLVPAFPIGPLWDHAHHVWQLVCLGAGLLFMYWSRDPGGYPLRMQMTSTGSRAGATKRYL